MNPRLVRWSVPRGFGLIEMLVAVAVVAIGLLGFAKMQALAIGSTHNSGTRALIALQASSLASAMRANEAYWGAGIAPASFTVSGAQLSDATLSTYTSDCTTVVCTPAQMAAFDARTWGASLAAMFPGAGATISCSTVIGTPVTCTITVNWSEKTVAVNAAVAAGSAPATLAYTLLVQP
ncbi:MAG TPA: type IV pilus modification protein PilV [Burkholderiaceae bacterium]|nr:type IV pilus modification protein PilV [Burkholderiaceae bacterium]